MFVESVLPKEPVDEVTFPDLHWLQPEFCKRGKKRGIKIKLGLGKSFAPGLRSAVMLEKK